MENSMLHTRLGSIFTRTVAGVLNLRRIKPIVSYRHCHLEGQGYDEVTRCEGMLGNISQQQLKRELVSCEYIKYVGGSRGEQYCVRKFREFYIYIMIIIIMFFY